ncbi:MAG: type I DNA topoisomerase [Calditrichaeota bacterium]|nr:type I DNA topoisomerase [Calditrichota bacterium]MCB9391528.1 type I DNA topoisomerase [Calditrichota bacterium]
MPTKKTSSKSASKTAKKAAKKAPAKKAASAKKAAKTSAAKKTSAKSAAKTGRSTAKRASRGAAMQDVSAVGRKFVIVESPAKARTLSGYLGSEFAVAASVGHVRDLPEKKLGVDVKNNFEPEYVTISGKEDVLTMLRRNARDATEVFIATDPDREGEAIAFHIAEEIDPEHKAKIRRVLFNEITRDAVKRALSKPGELDNQKVDAQQARRVLDRLVGYLVSPLLQKIIARGLSAGRVQSVALRLICEREAEIRAFVPVEYWTIAALLAANKKEKFEARLSKIDGKKAEVPDEKSAKAIVKECTGKEFKLTDLKARPTKSSPSAPYTTSTLQQDAARRLSFSNDRTMSAAQQLYEGVELGKDGSVGLITYMRTDSVRVAPEAISALREFVTERYGAEYLPTHARHFKTKNAAQDAHEAIRPTDVTRDPASVKKYLKPEQFKLYELIWKRFVASQMEEARFEVTTATLEIGKYEFRANGRRMLFPGHLQVLAEAVDDTPHDAREQLESEMTNELPALKVGKDYSAEKVTPAQHFTEPPPRYNAGSLVKTLDELGIGRPSTYAQIISVLVKRKYITNEQRRFQPTELGEAVSKVLIEQFPDVFNVSFTAQMEEELDSIENDGVKWQKVVKDFYKPFSADLERVKQKRDELKKATQEVLDKPCPDCGGELVIKWGRAGKFIACTNYPECRYTEPLESEKAPEVPETFCPKCGKLMAPKRSRFGWFLGCTGYPECKTIQPMPDPKAIDCPREGCGGKISARNSRRGKLFFGCSNYPNCDFVSWSRPVAEKCPACGNNYMEEKNLKAGLIHQCPKCKHKIEIEPASKP